MDKYQQGAQFLGSFTSRVLRISPLKTDCRRVDFTLGAGLLTEWGEMCFGGLEGFNYFYPPALHYNQHVPAVVFTGLKVDNNPAKPGEKGPIAVDIAVAKEIRLDYKQNFSIDFTT